VYLTPKRLIKKHIFLKDKISNILLTFKSLFEKTIVFIQKSILVGLGLYGMVRLLFFFDIFSPKELFNYTSNNLDILLIFTKDIILTSFLFYLILKKIRSWISSYPLISSILSFKKIRDKFKKDIYWYGYYLIQDVFKPLFLYVSGLVLIAYGSASSVLTFHDIGPLGLYYYLSNSFAFYLIAIKNIALIILGINFLIKGLKKSFSRAQILWLQKIIPIIFIVFLSLPLVDRIILNEKVIKPTAEYSARILKMRSKVLINNPENTIYLNLTAEEVNKLEHFTQRLPKWMISSKRKIIYSTKDPLNNHEINPKGSVSGYFEPGFGNIVRKTSSIVNTYKHEKGHRIHINILEDAIFKKWEEVSGWDKKGSHLKDSENFVTSYAMKDILEDFAETFEAWVSNSKELAEKFTKTKSSYLKAKILFMQKLFLEKDK
ncbi:hypothetical protein BVX93_00235, partial [bacterium B13(2017)]